MKAVAPQVPDSQAVIVAKNQPEYDPLPAAYVLADEGMTIVTRYELSDEERAAIASGADVFLQVLTGGGPLQPQRLWIGDAPDAN